MAQPDLITLTHPRSPASEAYRTLRTNLIFSSAAEPVKTLVVTSPAPGDGKSTALANLAVTLAQGGYKTLLVDCDLRRPSQHSIWGIDQEPGLTALMLDEKAKAEPVETGIDNLKVLPSGVLPPNPADLVGSPRMEAILKDLAKQADYVLFDVPPVIAVTDASLLATKTDGVMLVIRAGHTRRADAERAKELLDRIGARLLGAVMLDAQLESRMGAYYGE